MLWDDTAEMDAVCGDGGQSSTFSNEMAEPTSEITATVAGEESRFQQAESFKQTGFSPTNLLSSQSAERPVQRHLTFIVA